MDFIKKVWQLTTLRVSPEEVPYHRFYLFVAIGLNFLLGYLVTLFLPVTESALHLSSAMAIVMKAVNIFFLAFFLYLILYFSKKTNRFFKLFLSIVVGILLIEIVNFLVSMIVPFLAKYIFNIEFSTHAGFALLFNYKKRSKYLVFLLSPLTGTPSSVTPA